MAITITPSPAVPAAHPPGHAADPTDESFAALFALVAVPLLTGAPPEPGTTPPPGATTTASPSQDGSSPSPSAAEWEGTVAGGPAAEATVAPHAIHLLNGEMPMAPVAEATVAPQAAQLLNSEMPMEPVAEATVAPQAIQLLNGEMPMEEVPTASPVPDEAATDLTAPAPATDDAATTLELPATNGAAPHTANPRQVALSTLHDGSTPPPETDANLTPGESPPADATSPSPAVEAAAIPAAILATAAGASMGEREPTAPATRHPREGAAPPSAAITAAAPATAHHAPPTPPPPTAAPVVPSQAMTVVADRIRQSGPGRHRLEITLHPPELGRVEVHLVVGNHSVHAHLMAQSEAGRDALAHHLPTLREQLAAHGFTDAQVGVDLSGHGGERQQRWQPQSQPPPASVAEDATVTTPHRPHATDKRLLDRHA